MPLPNTLNQKLDSLLTNQKRILANEDIIIKNESIILKETKKVEGLEQEEIKDIEKEEREIKSEGKTELEELKELEQLEQEIKKIEVNPLKKITKRDLIKGFIGAFFGVVSDFAFSLALDIGKDIEIWRTILLYILSFIVIVGMLYYSGFRRVEKQLLFKFMPIRAIVLYIVSIITILLVYLVFGKIHFPLEFMEIFKNVGSAMMLAVIGAGMADLIGKDN